MISVLLFGYLGVDHHNLDRRERENYRMYNNDDNNDEQVEAAQRKAREVAATLEEVFLLLIWE